MRIRIFVISLCGALLAACTSFPAPPANAPRRDFTASEKKSLAASLGLKLKDPGSAQFRWAPVILHERGAIVDYCGFLNSRNSYGGYNGFSLFYAQLDKAKNEQFKTGEIRLIENPQDEASNGAVRSLCQTFGYGDLSVSASEP